MKKITIIFLLCSGMLLSLAGCQEKPDIKKGKAVEFAAIAGKPTTRTAYSGEGTVTAGYLSWERIDWVEDDQIRIWSDKATGISGHSATFAIYGVEEQGDESHASITGVEGDCLWYAEEGGAHKFWSIYPASAVSQAPEAESVSFAIPGSQAPAQNGKLVDDGNITYKPDMDLAVMLAAKEVETTGEKVDIYYYPAFTAFELSFMVDETYESDDPVTLHHVTLSSSSALVGTVAASIASGTRNFTVSNSDNYAFITNNKEYTVGKSTFTASSTAKEVTFTLPEPAQLAKGKELRITIVTLPQNINDLTVCMGMGNDGRDERVGTLKIGAGENKKNLAFAACQKHNIRGVLLKPNDWEFSTLTFNFDNPWEKVEFERVSSRDYPQSTQFEPAGNIDNLRDLLRAANNVSSGYNGYRQCWVFNADGTATVTYKVMLPAGGTWKLVPQGDTGSFVVSVSGATVASDGSFSGTIGNDGTTRVTFTIKPASGAYGTGKDPKAIYFKTYVTNAAGTTYSLDSETQLYDMRGFHYFILNTSDQNTVDGILNRLNQ